MKQRMRQCVYYKIRNCLSWVTKNETHVQAWGIENWLSWVAKWDDKKTNNVNMFHLIYERKNETMRQLSDKQFSLLQLY